MLKRFMAYGFEEMSTNISSIQSLGNVLTSSIQGMTTLRKLSLKV